MVTKKIERKRRLIAVLVLGAILAIAISANAATYGLYITGYGGDTSEEDCAAPGIWVESSRGWQFRLYDGTIVKNSWQLAKGASGYEYYHFGNDGYLDTGWFKDENGNWFYLNCEHDGNYGAMTRGWHEDREDGHKYYLEPKTGIMVTGAASIDGTEYYFNETVSSETWSQDADGVWHYNGSSELPYGAMR